jgi:hypothetical protein
MRRHVRPVTAPTVSIMPHRCEQERSGAIGGGAMDAAMTPLIASICNYSRKGGRNVNDS